MRKNFPEIYQFLKMQTKMETEIILDLGLGRVREGEGEGGMERKNSQLLCVSITVPSRSTIVLRLPEISSVW